MTDSQKPGPLDPHASSMATPSLEFLHEIERGKQREIRRRIADNFYDRSDVIEETARKLLQSGDLPTDE